MVSKVSSKRWEIAQNSEKEYWENFTDKSLFEEETLRHMKKADTLKQEWKRFIKINNKTKILQIGCGPEDIITHLKTGKRYAIDPLAEFYKKKFNLNYKNLTFTQGRGEELPFEADFFDIVIIANVLDHVENPQKVMLEIKRVLKKDGIFYFENLFYQKNFISLSKIWGPIKKIITGKIFNIHHPFMFEKKDLKEILYDSFDIINERIGRDIGIYENMEDMIEKKRKDKNFRIRLPAKLGLYGIINYGAVCKKKLLN